MPGGADGWSAVAYDRICGIIGNESTIFIYLLKPGQVITPSTLLFSYGGADPEIEWTSPTTLTIRVSKLDFTIKRTVFVGGVTAEYELPASEVRPPGG